jgi:hypothetical protein
MLAPGEAPRVVWPKDGVRRSARRVAALDFWPAQVHCQYRIPLRAWPNLEPGEAERRGAMTRRYRGVLDVPTADRSDDGFRVTAYVVHDQSLVRHELRVLRNGTVEDFPTLLEADLPLVFGV